LVSPSVRIAASSDGKRFAYSRGQAAPSRAENVSYSGKGIRVSLAYVVDDLKTLKELSR